ncbi:gamma-butyrobetaine hydroxylase-like domain-containing protein [Marinospirillum sp.]|uniref:gamma-butyrobetaine hydroxylase-like domain-containing protein n=1 Tax=Marinospirillum sp. TaxID=2183934 RepID=UPI00384FFD55
MNEAPQPEKVNYSKSRQCLELTYASGEAFDLSAEMLRVLSPSAEVQGHGSPILQTGKKDVRIWKIEPVGRYALKLSFDDGHDSGLFSWDYLWHLGQNKERLWQEYLDKLAAAGESREPKLIPLAVDAGQKN